MSCGHVSIHVRRLSPDLNPRDFIERMHVQGAVQLASVQLRYVGVRLHDDTSDVFRYVYSHFKCNTNTDCFHSTTKRKEGTGEWRKSHDEELHNLYSSVNISRVIKWRKIRRAEPVARMGQK